MKRVLVAASLFCGIVLNAQNPIIQTSYTSDPAPLVIGDTLYILTGCDEPEAMEGSYLMREWRLYSTTDMLNYTDHGAVLRTSDISWSQHDASAAQIIPRNGKYYLYISTLNNTPGHGGVSVGVAVADNVWGPYKDALGRALVTNDMTTAASHSWDDLDPTVFIDDDGQAYLYWGNGYCYWAKLNEDMISLGSDITPLDVKDPAVTGPEYTEGPWLYKHDGHYYLIYAALFPECIDYSMADNLRDGKWSYKGTLMPIEHGSNTNHPGVVDYKGHTWFFYHDDSLPGGHGYRRSVCVEEMSFNPDGTIRQLHMTEGLKEGVGVLDPYRRVEAETMAFSEGVHSSGTMDSGICITDIHSGDYIKLRSVDFGSGASRFTASAASRYFGGNIELHLDSVDGPLAGTLRTGYTGEWDRFREFSCEVSGAEGMHDLYLVFKGRPMTLMNLDWWRFDKQ